MDRPKLLVFNFKLLYTTLGIITHLIKLFLIEFERDIDHPKIIPVADPGFSPGGAPTPKIAIIFHIFAKNCTKMKEFGPPGGACIPGTPPRICQCIPKEF